MPYTTLVAGTTILASWANASVRDQVVTPFASTAARDSAITVPVDGMLEAITGIDALTYYDGAAWDQIGPLAAWTSYTPTVRQGGSTPAITNNDSGYMRIGRTIIGRVRLQVNAAGSGGNAATVSLPVDHKSLTASSWATVGHGSISYTGGAAFDLLLATMYMPDEDRVYIAATSTDANHTTALAAGNILEFGFAYEAAS